MATGPARRAIPRISTRGAYDLRTGAAAARRTRYTLWPRRRFEAVAGRSAEIAIVVHGMRNGRAGAAQKFAIAQRRLRALGYAFPVVGYTYDADVRGAHAASTAAGAARAAEAIAVRNGARLAAFIADHAAAHPRARVRLLGHSLGSLVIDSALRRLDARGGTARRQLLLRDGRGPAGRRGRRRDQVPDRPGGRKAIAPARALHAEARAAAKPPLCELSRRAAIIPLEPPVEVLRLPLARPAQARKRRGDALFGKAALAGKVGRYGALVDLAGL
ncbi:MAG: alpha/beta hydrolase [Thaumarchaeota archaeon S15]|nr:MAG: alpha/beta hydrolase [Thaumarchaeota archaeon S15]